MIGFLLQLVLAAAGLWLSAKILPGVHLDSTGSLIAAALLLGLANALVKPILVILTFPITLITLGLFLLVINGLMVSLVAFLLPGFHVDGLITAILAALIVSVTSWIGGSLVRNERRPRRD